MRLGRDRSSGKCSKSLLGAVLGGQSTSAGCPNLPQRFHGGQARWDALFSEWSWVGFLHPPLPPMTARVPDPEWSILGLGWELRSNARPGCQVNSIFGMRFSKFSVAKSQSSIHKSFVFLLAQTFAHVRHEIHHGAYTHRHAILYILIEIKRCHYRHNCTFQRPDVTEEAHTVFETQTLKLDAWDARDMALCWASSLYFRTFLKEACLLLCTFSLNTGWFFGRTIGFIEETQVCCRVFCICHSFGGLGRKYTRCQMSICSMHWLEFIDWHVMNLDIQTPLCIPALVACRSRIVSNWASVPSSQAPWSGKSQRWNSEWHNVRFGFGVWLSIVMIVYDCAMWWVSWSFFKFLPCSLWFQARTPSNFRRCAPTWAQPKLLQVSGGMESEQMVAVSRLAWYSLMAISSTQIWRIETFDFCEPFLLSPPKHSSFLSR